jgi:hypothetical protein
MMWVEKYRPKTINDYIGKDLLPAKATMQFLRSWKGGNPSSNAIILHGMPGVGKTCLVETAGNDLGYEIVSINSSDERNQKNLKDIIPNLITPSLDNKPGPFPVVMICNDIYPLKKAGVVRLNGVLSLDVKPPPVNEIVKKLGVIVTNEGVSVTVEQLNEIVRISKTVRSSIQTLQMCSMDRSFKKIIVRDVDKSPAEQIRAILSGEIKSKNEVSLGSWDGNDLNMLIKYFEANGIENGLISDLLLHVARSREIEGLYDMVWDATLLARKRIGFVRFPRFRRRAGKKVGNSDEPVLEFVKSKTSHVDCNVKKVNELTQSTDKHVNIGNVIDNEVF